MNVHLIYFFGHPVWLELLVPWPVIELLPSAVKVWSPNHWTTRGWMSLNVHFKWDPHCAVLSCSVVSNSFQPHGCSSPGSSVHEDSPGKSTGMGCQDSHKTLNTNLVMSHQLYKSKMSSSSTIYNHSLNQ